MGVALPHSAGAQSVDGAVGMGALSVSVDDRRALWALTTRHLRSKTFASVLVVRSALRAHAGRIDVDTRGDQLCVDDDGKDRAAEVDAIVAVLRDPTMPLLHALEARHGTDLLVALATSAAATLVTPGRRVVVRAGAVVEHGPAPASATSTTLTLLRPRSLRKEERKELAAWLPGPRAVLRVDGKAWKSSVQLPDSAFFARAFSADGGRGFVAFSLDDATSKTTVLSRGLWVAQDAQRARGLPVVAIWDDDDVASAATAVARARVAVERAAQALQRRLGEEIPKLSRRRRQKLRALLLRAPSLPEAFVDVPLFDDERGAFRVSLGELQKKSRVVIGEGNADVVVDADARAFLHRTLPTTVRDALPPPRRRLSFALRSLLP